MIEVVVTTRATGHAKLQVLLTPSSPGAILVVFDHYSLLVTLEKGCHASHQPSDTSTQLYRCYLNLNIIQ